MTGLGRDVRAAVRSLRRAPGVTLLAVAILGVGIGATTAVFSVVDAVLLRRLPYRRPGRIVRIWTTAPERGLDLSDFSHQRYLDVATRNASFSAVAAFTADTVTLTGRGEPVRLQAARVSAGVTEVLGLRPALGRSFLPTEETSGGPEAAILSDRLWRGRFGADPSIVGRGIDIDGTAHTVVGVLPAGVGFPDDATDLWIPRVDAPNFLNRGNVDRGSTYLGLVARLKPDVAPAAARADLDRLAATEPRAGFLDEGLRYRSLPIAEASTREARPMLFLLSGAVALVLLIACADVTNLLLVRAIERRREVAVRKALGAGRARLVRQFLVESVVMAGAAAVLGVALAKAALPALAALAARQRLPRAPEIGLDLRVLVFTSAVAVATGVIFGLAPALQGAGTDIRTGLLETSRTSAGDSRRRRVRSLLVAAEVALAVVLLVGAGLVLRTILRLEAVDPGFRADHLVAARIELPPSRYSRAEEMRGFFSRFRESLAALPGVESVGASQSLPLSADRPQTLVAAEGGPLPPISERPIVSLDTVAFDYFRTLGIPLLAGRTFDDADGPETPLRIVVNRRFARRFFPGRDAVGRHVFVGRSPKPVEIIGVVGDVRSDGLDAAPREAFYLSALQHTVAEMEFVLRTAAPEAALAPLVRQRLRALDPDEPLSELRTMRDVVGDSIGARRRTGLFLGVLAAVALALAAVGLFAVMAYSVRQRAPEIGVRMALGADPGRILASTVGEGLRLALLGLAVGLGAAAVATRAIRSLLFETRAEDPATIAAVSLFLLAVAAAASWLPARRAARTDPMVALRQE